MFIPAWTVLPVYHSLRQENVFSVQRMVFARSLQRLVWPCETKAKQQTTKCHTTICEPGSRCGNQPGASRSQIACLTDAWIRSQSQQDAVLSHLVSRCWKVKRGVKAELRWNDKELTALRDDSESSHVCFVCHQPWLGSSALAGHLREWVPVVGMFCWRRARSFFGAGQWQESFLCLTDFIARATVGDLAA